MCNKCSKIHRNLKVKKIVINIINLYFYKMFKKISFFKIFFSIFISLFFINNSLIACDTTPTLTVSNVIDNGDGTFYMDISACIGSGGSADGFDLYFNNDINILGTTVTEVTAPATGNTATVSVSNGIWLATYNDFDPVTNSPYFENGGWGLDCIDFGIIVDENPEGATLCSVGINEDCLGFTQNDVFITCGIIPGPCLPNYSITDNGSIDSDVFPAGQNCNFAPFNDEIIELTVTCDGNFNFTLTQDAGFWAGESWLTVASACCSGPIEQVMSFFEGTLTIDTYLTEGVYYVIVDIYSDGFQPGDYILDVNSSADLSLVTTSEAGSNLLTCEDEIVLNGNDPANNEIGTWSVISGFGVFSDPSSPTTLVTSLGNGENIFQWEIFTECTNSTDEVIIEVANNISFDIPNTVYCLDDIPLNVIGGNNNGEWSVEPNLNVQIDNISANNTFASVTAYGTYIFSYTICGEEFSTTVNVESSAPILSSISNTYSCLESFSLNAVIEGDPGYWEGEGPFLTNIDNPISLNPTITVNGYGTYLFTYYGCGTNSSIEINMTGIEPSTNGPEDIYCLEPFELNATVDGDPGYWSFSGPGNAIFNDQELLNPIVTVDEYGTYEFIYNGCGESSEPIYVNSLAIEPQIISPTENLNIYCELESQLEAIVLGDPGYWDYQGPGNAIFSNPTSTSTNVIVNQYGEYTFTYYGCGTNSETAIINFEPVQPEILAEQITSCALSTNLEAIIDNGQNIEWFINNSPTGTNASFTNSTSVNTELIVSDYGTYEIGLNGCGNTTLLEIQFEPTPPHIIAPNFQNCILTASLIAYTDDPSQGGPWEQIYGEPGVIFTDQTSNFTDITVPNFGLYSFAYPACDTVSIINIGFECPLVFSNVITPNDDGNNEQFIIKNLNPEIYTESIFTVYNRWGVIVYNTTGYGISGEWWNGKTTYNNTQVTDGVYYYVLEVFNNVTKEREKYTGDLNIFMSNSSSSNENLKMMNLNNE
jgi:gliding motility-associated-like protein